MNSGNQPNQSAFHAPPEHAPSGLPSDELEPSATTARPLPTDPVVTVLRSMMGLDPWDRTQGEDAATLGRSFPAQINNLDADGWIAWCLVGLAVFALPGDGTGPDPRRPWMRSCEDSAPRTNRPWIPSIRTASREVRRLVAVLAMLRNGGNVTHAAQALGTSRRVLREQLKAAGLYPWGRVVGKRSGGEARREAGGPVPSGIARQLTGADVEGTEAGA